MESNLPEFFTEDPLRTETAEATATPEYHVWIDRLKVLAVNIGAHMWELGDLLLEGDSEFNYENLGVPSYMLIGAHPPNYWKQVSDDVGLGVASLKQYAAVARAFPPEKRIKELTWTHHLVAHKFVDRDTYLRAAIEYPNAPHTVRWLEDYIDRMEGCVVLPKEELRSVSLDLPLPIVRKLRDLEQYYGVSAGDLIANAIKPAVDVYVEEQRQKLSMKFFDFYDDSTWPFGVGAQKLKEALKPKRRTKHLVTISRQTKLGPVGGSSFNAKARKRSVIEKHASSDSSTPENSQMLKRAHLLSAAS
jgi:hypothetical protein